MKPAIRHIAILSMALGLLGILSCTRKTQNFHELIRGPLFRVDGTWTTEEELKGKMVLVYFSASWCPPCHRFTPELAAAYDEWMRQGKAVEVVMVSGDNAAADMVRYMRDANMRWLGVPFDDTERTLKLEANWGVRGYPTLIVVSPDGKTLTTRGVDALYAGKAAVLDAWFNR